MTVNSFLARLASEPVLVAPLQADKFAGLLNAMVADKAYEKLMGRRMGDYDDDDDNDQPCDDDDNFWPAADSWLAQFRPYVVKDGILHIPVKGVLLSGFPYQMWDFATGYEYIQKAFDRGMADPVVTGIAFDLDSPGGMVKGCFDLVDHMRANKDKPVQGFADESAYSAAYAIAAVADAINVVQTGGVGSVGVITMHCDYSKYLENAGVKITLIFSGSHKADGNPYEALPASVKDRIQARIDSIYAIFCASVADGRDMDIAAVRATEALTYSAEDAISVGFADSAEPTDKALAAFVSAVNPTTTQFGVTTMTVKNPAAGNENAAANTTDEAALAAAKAEGVSTGAKAAKDRISAIFALDEAKKRPQAANVFALETDMAVDAVKAALAKMPEESTGADTKAAFERAMGTDNPNLGTGAQGNEQGEDKVARILSAQNHVHGKKPAKAA